MKARRSAAGLLAMAFLIIPAASAQNNQYPFSALTPEGYEVIALDPSGATVSLLALVECPEIEGAQQVSAGQDARVVAANGATLTHFPRRFSFRITATLRKTVVDDPSWSLNTPDDPRQFLMKLGFRLKAYNGLNMQVITPKSLELIGMPADVAYDERVIRVNFDVGDRPITDRFVLEVFSPQGQRIARFHFGLL
ncbi:MAG: hypothetical protein ACM3PW_02025 [Chlamydiota bacterium]